MKKIIDFLRKIGVLHVSKSDYYSGEYDTHEDLKEKNKESAAGQGSQPENVRVGAQNAQNTQSVQGEQENHVPKTPREKKGKTAFLVTAGFLTFLLLIFILSVGIKFSSLFLVFLYGGFIYFMHKRLLAGSFNVIFMIVVSIILVVVLLMLVPSDSGNDFKVSPDDKAESATNLEKYDGKVYNVSSKDDVITGTVALTHQADINRLRVTYNLQISATYPENKVCFAGTDPIPCRTIDYFNYAGGLNHPEPDFIVSGQVYPNFCDSFQDILDPKDYSRSYYINCWIGKELGFQETGMYFFGAETTYKSYIDFTKADTFTVYDATPYVIREHNIEGSTGKASEQYKMNEAVTNGEEIARYELEFTER